MIKVVIVDDQEIMIEGIKCIIEHDPELEVVGCAKNGLEALALCEEFSPDIVLMDIIMPVCDGIESTKLIKSKFGSTKVLILTTFSDGQNILDAIKNGADGYVLKDISPQELTSTIKSMVRGLNVINHNVFEVFLKQITIIDKDEPQTNPWEGTHLSEQEKAIVQLITFGKNNKEIAATVHLSEGRVRNIITGILEKLQLKDRTQLAVFAVKNKLI